MEGGVGGGGWGGGGLPGRCKAGRASGDEGSHWCQAGAGYLFVWGSWEYWKHLLADKELMLSNTLQCRRCVCFVSRATFSTPDVVRLIVGREGVHSDAHIIFLFMSYESGFWTPTFLTVSPVDTQQGDTPVQQEGLARCPAHSQGEDIGSNTNKKYIKFWT